MNRKRVLVLWKEFRNTIVKDKVNKCRKINYLVSKHYIDESEYLDEFLFDFVNFIEKVFKNE